MPDYLRNSNAREDGFTLIELLIVVLIIGVLAAIAIPVYLGIQNASVKAAVRSDVNITVKRIQVAMTEGKNIDAVVANPSDYTQASQAGETVSPDKLPGENNYTVTGIISTQATPKPGRINYTYAYDSRTGKFTESDSGLGQSATLAITTGSVANATLGQPYSQQISTSGTNNTGSTTYTMTGLPAKGLDYNPGTGVISGTPTSTGDISLSVTASNGSATATRSYTLRVYSIPTITTANLPNATVGSSYNQTLATTGVPAVSSFTITSGAIPTGLTFDTTSGNLSGTANTSGSYTFTVTATNSAGTSTPASYTVTIGGSPQISTASLPWAYTNAGYGQTYTAYNQTVTATGYPSPTYQVTAGTLPTGVTLNQSSGKLSGDATTNGTTNFTITATNSFGTDVKNYTFKTGTYIRGCDDGAELAASQGCGSYGTYYNPTATYTTEQKYAESWSWKITTTNQGVVQGIISCPGGQNYNLPSGTAVQARAWISGTANSTWSVGGRTSYDEANGQNGVTLTGVGTWQQVGADYTLTQASTAACIQVRQPYNFVGQVLYMDNVTFAYAKP